jgi:hypothetical protein
VPKLVEDMSVENLVDWLRQLNVNEEAIKVLQIYHAVGARDRAAGGVDIASLSVWTYADVCWRMLTYADVC